MSCFIIIITVPISTVGFLHCEVIIVNWIVFTRLSKSKDCWSKGESSSQINTARSGSYCTWVPQKFLLLLFSSSRKLGTTANHLPQDIRACLEGRCFCIRICTEFTSQRDLRSVSARNVQNQTIWSSCPVCFLRWELLLLGAKLRKSIGFAALQY